MTPTLENRDILKNPTVLGMDWILQDAPSWSGFQTGVGLATVAVRAAGGVAPASVVPHKALTTLGFSDRGLGSDHHDREPNQEPERAQHGNSGLHANLLSVYVEMFPAHDPYCHCKRRTYWNTQDQNMSAAR